jgi:pimeloyl-ACP methyl ester carboxylesterase
MRRADSMTHVVAPWLGSTLLAVAANASGAESVQTRRIPGPTPGLSLAVHHMPARAGQGCGSQVVLFIHGATFPSRLAAGYPFGGESWMAHMASRGCDVWALDFLGYGDSDRYPQMRADARAAAPLGRAPEAAEQIASVVDFILKTTHAPAIVLVAHSWGTIPASLFTTRAPNQVARLVLFGPVAQRHEKHEPSEPVAYHDITIEQQRTRFDGYVPAGEPLLIDRAELEEWSRAYLASDVTSMTRTPPGVRVPAGPVADLDDAWTGHLGYDPARIRVPTLIVYGEWDAVTRDADAVWLADAIGRTDVRVHKLPRGTHVMHLESQRGLLRTAVDDFLGVRAPIQGYGYGADTTARSPVTLDELTQLEKAVGWTAEDQTRLRQSCVWIAPLAESLVDEWRVYIGKLEFLSRWSAYEDGRPAEDYRAAVKRRFVQWIRDTCERERDQAWLDYANEIAVRHTPIRKNQTDHAQTPPLVPLRYLVTFSTFVTTSIGARLQSVPATPEAIAGMQRSWNKIVQLQLALWTRPYTRDGWW